MLHNHCELEWEEITHYSDAGIQSDGAATILDIISWQAREKAIGVLEDLALIIKDFGSEKDTYHFCSYSLARSGHMVPPNHRGPESMILSCVWKREELEILEQH